MMANEGSYPENARALALNGAEVVYIERLIHTQQLEMRYSKYKARARALDNNMYVLAPNMGTYYLQKESDIFQ